MLEVPSIVDTLSGKSDAPLFNPLEPPVTDEGQVETPINECGENINKIMGYKKLLGDADYRDVLDNAIKGKPFKHANTHKTIKLQKAMLSAMAERLDFLTNSALHKASKDTSHYGNSE